MSYEVLARKWRPQQFDEVVGQAHVTQTLRNAITSKRIAHAYVFVGPRGVGKTSIARIMAKALNCEKGPTDKPCDACDACREIKDGRNLDVLEIDGASNTGVDHVRELRENVRYAPARGPFKIYIIDEVHMLSIGAFNALLKTLEEPPEHVKFFFATTEVQKIPATILSRCQRFDLRRIATRDIIQHLAKLAKAEKIDIDDDALLAIARGAEGGLRDAESALDQLVAFRGKTIREPDVLAVFGLVSREALERLVRAILKGDAAAILKRIAELDAAGKDLQRINFELLDYLRNLLVVAAAGTSVIEDLPEAQVAALKELAAGTDGARALKIVDELVNLQGQLRYALSRRTLLEVSLIRCARVATTVTIDDILSQINKLKQSMAGAATAVPTARSETIAPPPSPPPAIAPSPGRVEAPAAAPAAASAEEVADLAARWREFVEKVGVYAPLARSYLRDAKPVEVTRDRVVIGFDPEFASERQKIDVPRNVTAIQKALADVLKRSVSVELRVLAGGAPAALPADSKPDAAKVEGRAPKGKGEWVKDPAVKRALETFHGDIVDIRE
jgi:DNA polymerase-3 subunit gamma/tau